MKTIRTLVIPTLILSLLLSIGEGFSFAQENDKKKDSQTDNTTKTEAAKVVYTSPAVSFLHFRKLTEPLQTEERTKMMTKILEIIKQTKNKKVPDLKSSIQGDSLSSEYYEISGDLSGRKLTVQYIPPVQGKNAGNVSFSWDEKNEKSKAIENWFVSLFLDGLVETALDSRRDKLMVTSGSKIVTGKEHQKFWQLQADQILQELHEELTLIGKLE
jgi:hypothetical protein